MSSPYEIIEPEFRGLIVGSARLDVLYDGCRWAEGPVWFGDMGCLLFSDIPNNRMLHWTPEGVTTFRADSGFANGNTRDREGRLVTCEHGARRVTRTEYDGSLTVIAERHAGKRLNSPNDVVVKSDGTIWFTDPPYGILSDYEGHKAEQDQDGCYVYRVDPDTGDITVVADDFVKPNGLAFTPDESALMIADSGFSHDPDAPHHIRRFTVNGDNSLTDAGVFADVAPGVPDGFRFDTGGRLWTSAGDGVHAYAPDGRLLGKIRTPAAVANVTFGGPKRNRLFITATDCLLAIYLTVNGAARA